MTSHENEKGLASLFGNLWAEYTESNPEAKKIHDLILRHELQSQPNAKELKNDHIALRTFDIEKIGIEALAQHFKKYGYVQGGEYFFVNKKLYARHFEHPDPSQPKLFISELQLEKCSPFVREVAQSCADAIRTEAVNSENFLWSGRPWSANYQTYEKLLEESEYAAWLYAFGFRSNHFTVSFNELKSFKELADLNRFLKEQGIPLNASGGEIKGNRGECLEQSSTLAEKVKVQFTDGTHEIPSCYYEFAKRYSDTSGKLYQGFVAASADKIFESTNVKN